VVGLGGNCDFTERWHFKLTGFWSRSDGEADLFSPPGGTPNTAVGFDDYEDIELYTAEANLDFDLNERFGIGFGYRYEDYVTESFVNRGLDYYLPSALLLNADNGNYQGDVFSFRLRFTY
ncbi:MAG: MtrB/PioB family outer membrane beta-barrel protein, partial [Thermoanaerobaculia bacterium]